MTVYDSDRVTDRLSHTNYLYVTNQKNTLFLCLMKFFCGYILYNWVTDDLFMRKGTHFTEKKGIEILVVRKDFLDKFTVQNKILERSKKVEE